MKLYARQGFEWAEDGLVGLWSPVSTGATQGVLLDCNPSTSNHGAMNGYTDINTAWVGSRYGTVLSFNGSSNYAQIPSRPNFTPSKNWSILVWYNSRILPPNPSLSYEYCLLSNSQATSPYNGFDIRGERYRTGLDNFELSIAISGTEYQISCGPITTNSWTFISATYDGIVLRTFRNGRQYATLNVTGSINLSSQNLRIGDNPSFSPRFFNGFVAELEILNRVCESQQVLSAFEASPGGMWQDRPRRSRAYFGAAGFKAYWARRQAQLIGGGL